MTTSEKEPYAFNTFFPDGRSDRKLINSFICVIYYHLLSVDHELSTVSISWSVCSTAEETTTYVFKIKVCAYI